LSDKAESIRQADPENRTVKTEQRMLEAAKEEAEEPK
jgi:hypothetical protein